MVAVGWARGEREDEFVFLDAKCSHHHFEYETEKYSNRKLSADMSWGGQK